MRHANTAGTLEARIAREGVLIAGQWTRPALKEGKETRRRQREGPAVVQSRSGKRALGHELARGGEQLRIRRRQRSRGEDPAHGRAGDEGDPRDLRDLRERHPRRAEDGGRARERVPGNRWRKTERSEFAKRIRALESKGRRALRAEKQRRAFEPLDETIRRLGKVLGLLIEWLSSHATLYPEAEEMVAEHAKNVDYQLHGRGAQSVLRSVSPELVEHVRETRAGAQRLAAKLGTR